MAHALLSPGGKLLARDHLSSDTADHGPKRPAQRRAGHGALLHLAARTPAELRDVAHKRVQTSRRRVLRALAALDGGDGLDRFSMNSSNPVGSNAHAFAGALVTAYQLIRPPANRG